MYRVEEFWTFGHSRYRKTVTICPACCRAARGLFRLREPGTGVVGVFSAAPVGRERGRRRCEYCTAGRPWEDDRFIWER